MLCLQVLWARNTLCFIKFLASLEKAQQARLDLFGSRNFYVLLLQRFVVF